MYVKWCDCLGDLSVKVVIAVDKGLWFDWIWDDSPFRKYLQWRIQLS